MDMFKGSKGKSNFSITSTEGNSACGPGTGVIDLNNVAPVIIEGDEAYLDMGAMHARSKVEKGIKFLTDKSEVPNGKKAWIVWVAVDQQESGPYYAGVTACEMLIDRENRRGYKILAQHVNNMDYAMKRRIILDGLDDTEKKALRTFLQEHKPGFWENSGDELKQALATED